MAEEAARLAKLYKGDTTTGTVVAAVRTKGFSINKEYVDVTTKDSAAWRKLLASVGSRSCDMTVEGVKELTQATFITDALAETIDLYTFQWSDGSELAGQFALTGYEENGTDGEAQTYSATLMSSGAVTYTP